MTYILKEGTFTRAAVGYYLTHRKNLKSKNCLARVVLTRGKGHYRASNIIEAIDFILTSNIRITRNNKDEDEVANPLSEVNEGDFIHYGICMFHEFWKYDGEKLTYEEE